MRRILILASLLVFSCFTKNASGQKKIQAPQPSKQEIELLYNHYIQDGNNSAVTGGIGTEKLNVYGPSVRFTRQKGKGILNFKGGTDIISSASTDNIDSIQSSASVLDARTYANANYARYFPQSKWTIDAGFGASIESDYFSYAPEVGATKGSTNGLRNVEMQFKAYFDDLRWGRLNPGYNRPVKLIYPDELRYQEWTDLYKRQSYNLNIGVTQVLNKRNVLGLFAFVGMQNGLLSTPFHRVYFNSDSLAIEKLPNQRKRFSLSLKWNSFVGGRVIVKNTAYAYADNFGVLAASLKHETAFKINPIVTVLGDVKLYAQQASDYFAPHQEHEITDLYYTSDYDMSQFQTVKLGTGFKFRPHLYKTQPRINLITLRYHHYLRSNSLRSHAISFAILLPLSKKMNP